MEINNHKLLGKAHDVELNVVHLVTAGQHSGPDEDIGHLSVPSLGGFDVDEALRQHQAITHAEQHPHIAALEEEEEGYEESTTPTTDLEEGSLIESDAHDESPVIVTQEDVSPEQRASPEAPSSSSEDTQIAHHTLSLEEHPQQQNEIELNEMVTRIDEDEDNEDEDDDDEDDDGESTRDFLFRLARKIGKTESDVLPFIEKLEKEWLLQKAQLKPMSEDAFVARLGFPLGLVQQIREELGVLQPQVPGMLKYKFEIKQQEQEKESKSGPGRKRKRLTVSDWSAKVEQFARNTKHSPSPFRVASIFQVECYCCGYAVNMNKPGQLYYLKRHVEGTRPDMRTSNHFKNYQRWRQQYQGSDGAILLPQLKGLPPSKKFKGNRGSMGSPSMHTIISNSDPKMSHVQQIDTDGSSRGQHDQDVHSDQVEHAQAEFSIPDIQHLDGFDPLLQRHQTLATLEVASQHPEVFTTPAHQVSFGSAIRQHVSDDDEMSRAKAMEEQALHTELEQHQHVLQQQLQQQAFDSVVRQRVFAVDIQHQLLQLHQPSDFGA